MRLCGCAAAACYAAVPVRAAPARPRPIPGMAWSHLQVREVELDFSIMPGRTTVIANLTVERAAAVAAGSADLVLHWVAIP